MVLNFQVHVNKVKEIIKNNIYLAVGIISLISGRFLFIEYNTPVYSQNNSVKDVSFLKTNNKQEVIQTEKELLTPPPLSNLNSTKTTYPAYTNQNSTFLDSKGVIAFTNIQRERYGFTPLSENIQLDNSAAMKVDDIFQKQYFEHVSPSGVNIEDLSKKKRL